MRCRAAAFVVLLSLSAAACGSDDISAPGDDSIPAVDDSTGPSSPATTVEDATDRPVGDSLQGAWLLTALTVDGERFDVLADWPVTMTIDGPQIGGTAACNGYGGTVHTDGDGGGRFVVEELSWTEMGCEPFVMELEQRYLTALQAVDSYELAEGLFLGKNGADTSLQFERETPVPDAELIGTRWVLDTLLSGDAASNMPDMDMAFLEFAADGTLTGSTGCRRLEGIWRASGASLEVPALTAIDDPTAGVCSPESQSLDGQFMSVVESGVTVEIDGQRITLTAPGGDGLSFRVGDPVEPGATDATTANLDPAGGVDGPVMYARRTDSTEYMAAEVRGTLVREGECLYVTADFGRFPVLWPFGTRWQVEPEAVVLPNGRTIQIGEDFSGGGGYVSADAFQGFTVSGPVAELADRCADGEYREVAVAQIID